MLTADQISRLIQNGESDTLEFKCSFQKEVIETITAFANSSGGMIFIGVDDKGNIRGTEISRSKIPNIINTIKQNTSPSVIPDIDIYSVNKQDILVIQVDEFPVKPVAYKGRYYQRRQNSNHQMTVLEIANAHLKSMNSSWDYYKDPSHTIHDIAMDKVEDFIRMTGIRDSVNNVLHKFELIKNDSITFGAYLLFTNNDNAITTTIEAGRLSSETIIKDSLSIRGDLFSEVKAAMDFVKKHINKAYVISGSIQREERWDYPLDAIREIVINMIVHRDYQHSGHSTIKIFDDQIEFFNYGALPAGLTIEMIKSGDYRSMPRNLQIAAVFKEAGIIEKYGSGIKRVIQSFRDYGLKEPQFKEIQGGLSVTVFKQIAGNGVSEGLSEGLNEGLKLLLMEIKRRPGKKTGDYADMLDKSPKTLERWLAVLKNKRMIEYRGSKKTGGYFPVILSPRSFD